MRKLLLSLMLCFIVIGNLLAQNCSINAGLSNTICLSDTMKLFGTRSGFFFTNTTSKWTQVSGHPVTIVNPDSLVTRVTGYVAGDYIFKLNSKCQDGIISEDIISIKVLPQTIATAGRDTVVCPGSNYNLTGNNILSTGERGIWTIVNNGVGVTIESPTNSNSVLTLSPSFPGITKLRWTIININGCSSYDDIVITNCGGVAPVNAGPDQTLDNCYSTTTCTKLVATNGGMGYNNQIGTWTFISGPSVPSISQINNPITIVCNLNQGTYVFRYTVNGPCASGSDEVAVTVPPYSQNVSTVNSNLLGTSTVICDGVSSITLTGNNPSYAGEVVQWTQTSGPVMVNILTPNNPSTLVNGFTESGSYTFRYNITNTVSGCSGNSEVRIVSFNTGTIDAGPDINLACNVKETTIEPVKTGYGSVTYRIINGPPGAFVYPTLPNHDNRIRNLIFPGTYTVEVSYQFGPDCPSVNDFVNITVSHKPTGSNAGTSQNFTCEANSTQLAGNNPALTGVGSGVWSQVSGPNTSILLNPTNYICNVNGTIPGVYTFRWTVSGGNNCPDNHDDIVVITPDSSNTKADAGLDRMVCYNSPVTLKGNLNRADETVKWTVLLSNGISFYPSNTVSSPTINGLNANTSYSFVYTVTNTCGKFSTDTVLIKTSAVSGPSVAKAGSNQCLTLGTNKIQLNATPATSGTGIWKQIEGPSSSITQPTLYNSTVLNVINGTYKFVWSVTAEGCNNNTSDTVKITISGNTTIANAGPDLTKCGNSVNLNANIPEYGQGHWTQISGDGNAVINSANNPLTTISNLKTGNYIFRWNIDNGACSSNFDDILINISSPPSVANAGPDQSVCGFASSATLHAVAPVSGTGQWAWVSGSTNYPTITNCTSPVTQLPYLRNGSHVFRWIVSGGPACPQTYDDVVVNVSSNANAGEDRNLCNLTCVSLSGNNGSNGIWSQIAGPATEITQTPVGNPNANINGLLPGKSYTFKYTIPSVSGCQETSDDVVINNGSPALNINAGIDDIYCNATSFKLNASFPGPGEKGTWTIISGQNANSYFSDVNDPNALLNGVTTGTYLLRWTISNGSCSNSDVKRIDNYATPTTANAGEDDTLCFTNSVTLNANSPVNGIGTWSQISGPNTVSFDAPNNPNSRVSGLKIGTYRLMWTISNHSCSSSSDEVNIVILNNADIAKAGNSQNICSSTTILKANSPTGNNKGIWIQYSGPNKAAFSSNTNPNCNVSNLIPGKYKFIWKIYNERCYSIDTTEITVNPSVNVYAGNDLQICNKTSGIILKDASINGYTKSGYWSIVLGDGTLSSVSTTDKPYEVIFSPSPDFSGTVILRLTTNDKCNSVYDEINIFVASPDLYIDAASDYTRTDPNTSININVLKNDKIQIGDTLKLCNNSIISRPIHGSATINNDGTITYKPVFGFLGIDSFNYKLCNIITVKDLNNKACVTQGNDNAWVYITIEGCTLPNSFSPDGDGVNDFFEIPCAQGNVQFNVYNRWGIEVYKNNFYKNEWDGTYNGAPLPVGTYFYMVKYSSDNKTNISKDGFINLRR